MFRSRPTPEFSPLLVQSEQTQARSNRPAPSRWNAVTITLLVVGCLVVVVGLSVAVKFALFGVGVARLSSIRPVDVTTTTNIDPLSTAAGLTLTDQTHSRGNVNASATWTKTFSAPTAPPVCQTVLQAATTAGYDIATTLGVTADNCVAQAAQAYGGGDTIVTAPDGVDIYVTWNNDLGVVTMIVDGPPP